MDIKLKNRLVGALVLFVAAIVLFPILFKSPVMIVENNIPKRVVLEP